MTAVSKAQPSHTSTQRYSFRFTALIQHLESITLSAYLRGNSYRSDLFALVVKVMRSPGQFLTLTAGSHVSLGSQ